MPGRELLKAALSPSRDDALLQRLRDALLSPAARPKEVVRQSDRVLEDSEVADLFKRRVPGLDQMVYRNSKRPVLGFIITTHRSGLRNEAIADVTRRAMQFTERYL